jgi:hypothetical protein
MAVKRDPVERFWAKVEKTDTCWLWTAALNSNSYGHIDVDGHSVKAHRFSYELLVGPVPEGLDLDHLCRVRHCVRPDHLQPVTRPTNILRGNGMGARHSRQTHCVHGHPLSGNNLLYSSNGTQCGRPRFARRCRECLRRNGRASMRRKRAAEKTP